MNVHGDTVIHVGKELNIEIAQNGIWEAGELFEQICEQFDLEGYELVELSGPGGSILISRNGIELIGDVYVEGELVEEGEEGGEGDVLFYYSTRLDVYDIYGNCCEKIVPYTILDSQENVVTTGMLDIDGRTNRVYRETKDKLKVLVGHAQVID